MGAGCERAQLLKTERLWDAPLRRKVRITEPTCTRKRRKLPNGIRLTIFAACCTNGTRKWSQQSKFSYDAGLNRPELAPNARDHMSPPSVSTLQTPRIITPKAARHIQTAAEVAENPILKSWRCNAEDLFRDARKCRNRPNLPPLATDPRHKRPGIPYTTPYFEIRCLRLATVSGISVINGAVAEWLKAAVC